MKFDLCIVDGNIVSGDSPCRLGLVMASRDPVAIDNASANISSINPKQVKYIALAQKEGLGSTRFTLRGEPLKFFKDRYPKRTFRTKMMSKAYSLVLKLGLSKRLGLS